MTALFESAAAVAFALAMLKTTVLLGLAFLAGRGLSRASAAVRHFLWAWTLTGCLLLPFLSLALPRFEWKILTKPTEAVGSPVSPAQERDAPRQDGGGIGPFVPAAAPTAEPAPSPSSQSLASTLFGVYWIVSGALLAYLLLGLLRLAALKRRSDQAPVDGQWHRLLDELRRDLRIKRPVQLGFCDRIETAFAWGLFRPVIVLPVSAAAWTPSLRRTVLVHELSHLRQLHWIAQLVGRLACCIYWVNPLIWLGARRLSLEGERSCDDGVLLSGARPSLYARQLVVLASRGARLPRPALPALPIVRRTQIYRRIESILSPKRRRTRMNKTTALAISFMASLLLSTLAAATLGPAEPSPQKLTERNSAASGEAPTELMRAVDTGDQNRAAALLGQGADVNQVVSGHRTALIRAAYRGDAGMVRLLLRNGADPGLIDRGRSRDLPEVPRSSLGAAAVSGNTEVVELLLSAGVSPEFTPRGEASPLMLAAAKGHGQIVDRLLSAGADANRNVGGEGSALMQAAASGNLESAKTLIVAGADVNARIRGDGSPLISAAAAGEDEIVELLLDRGADPNMAVRGDGTPLVAALGSGNRRTVQLLLERGADPNIGVRGDPSPIAQAARQGDAGTVEELLESGADPDLRFRGDPNALMMAATRGDLDVLEVLIRGGADPNAAARGDGNALIAAARAGRLEVADYLLDSGADPNGAVSGDGSALIAAAQRGDLPMIDLLLTRGADVNLIVEGDENPLINAARNGHLEAAAVLIEAGADVNVVVREGDRTRSALSEALRAGHVEMANFLRRHGAVR